MNGRDEQIQTPRFEALTVAATALLVAAVAIAPKYQRTFVCRSAAAAPRWRR